MEAVAVFKMREDFGNLFGVFGGEG